MNSVSVLRVLEVLCFPIGSGYPSSPMCPGYSSSLMCPAAIATTDVYRATLQ